MSQRGFLNNWFYFDVVTIERSKCTQTDKEREDKKKKNGLTEVKTRPVRQCLVC